MSQNWYALRVFRNLRRKWRKRHLGNLIVSNGEAIRRLQRENVELQFAGIPAEDIRDELERRERRHDQLLATFKEAV